MDLGWSDERVLGGIERLRRGFERISINIERFRRGFERIPTNIERKKSISPQTFPGVASSTPLKKPTNGLTIRRFRCVLLLAKRNECAKQDKVEQCIHLQFPNIIVHSGNAC